jgi:predicted DCC family thiol-disulfide oxidoreductase YuxK
MDLPVLVYDGHCRFCRKQAERVARWAGGRLRLESFHDPGVLERYHLRREACEQAMQLVLPGGTVYAGAEAGAQALRLDPSLAWLGALYYLPMIRQAADAGYGWIARNRNRFGGRCTDGSCAHR